MKGIIVTVEGEVKEIEFNNVDALEVFQGAVKGYIEYVRFPILNMCMIVNEEGLIYDLPNNLLGTYCYRTFKERGTSIRGDVLFIGYGDGKGNDTGLNEAQIQMLKGIESKII